jgi:chromosome segregation ATPase
MGFVVSGVCLAVLSGMSTRKEKKTSASAGGNVTRKEMIAMNSTASAIQGVLDNLRIQLQMLDNEIKADERSKAEFERHLKILNQKKTDIEMRIQANEEWSKSYDSDIGPFAQKSGLF